MGTKHVNFLQFPYIDSWSWRVSGFAVLRIVSLYVGFHVWKSSGHPSCWCVSRSSSKWHRGRKSTASSNAHDFSACSHRVWLCHKVTEADAALHRCDWSHAARFFVFSWEANVCQWVRVILCASKAQKNACELKTNFRGHNADDV